MNINGSLFSYTRTFGDGLRNFEPWSSDKDITLAGTPPSPNYHTTLTGGRLSSQQIPSEPLPYTAGLKWYSARTHDTQPRSNTLTTRLPWPRIFMKIMVFVT
ncbi:hypothetical protein TNCV_2928081 [Trichonephila clavipes]|nr:hypothetical protein TNCV_2928081 [Trichonephila clavipes]